mmetsp:Transcript_24811/g.59011  ORF Transcript_24811/g.59011 Transcript_24811/m.59011 type:complete len:417 (+) Transcript_24811:107-1357(+)
MQDVHVLARDRTKHVNLPPTTLASASRNGPRQTALTTPIHATNARCYGPRLLLRGGTASLEDKGEVLELLLELCLALLHLLLLEVLVHARPALDDAVEGDRAVHGGVAEVLGDFLGEFDSRGDARLLHEARVRQHQRRHGLDDGDGAGHDAGVVATLRRKRRRLPCEVGGGLSLADGGGGLERQPQHDRHPVADSALDAARVVGLRDHLSLLVDHKHVVVLGPSHLRALEPRPDLEPLGSRDAHHGVGHHGLELVEARLSEPNRHVPHHHRHHAPDRVLVRARRLDALGHLLGGRDVRAAHHVLVHLVARERLQVDLRLRAHHVPHRGDPRHDLDAILLLEPLLCDRARSDAADGLTCRRAAAARRGAEAVLHLVREVRVRGARDLAHVTVVVRAHVLVAHEEPDGRAQGEPLLGS